MQSDDEQAMEQFATDEVNAVDGKLMFQNTHTHIYTVTFQT